MRQARPPRAGGVRAMPLLEEHERFDITPSFPDETAEKKQRRQMLVALALLLAALILVLIKDRDFWFPPAPVAQVQSEAEPVEEPPADVKTPSETATASTPATVPARPKSKRRTPPPATVDPGPAPAL